jgi:ABC-2 type transport system permease protein
MRATLARMYPRVIGANREKTWIFFEVLLPCLAVAAYVFIYRALRAPAEFIGFVVLGGAMGAFWANVMWAMANQLYWEKETGNLALYIMAPMSLMAVLLGMALGGMFNATTRAVAILVVGSVLFGVHFSTDHLPTLILAALLTMVALYGMGMLFASLFLLFGRETWHLVSLAQEPVHFCSGMYFPIKSLGVWVAAAASLIPLTLGLDAIRQLTIPTAAALKFISVERELWGLGMLIVLFLAAARFMLRYMEQLAIAEGRLTQSRS